MAYCSKCGGEYVDGIEVCPKCFELLISKEELEDGKDSRQDNYIKELKEKLLTNVISIVELNYITSALFEMGIGYRVIEEKEGAYLTVLHGRSYVGKSIYVDSSRYKEAAALLESLKNTGMGTEDADMEYGQPPKTVSLFKKIFKIVVIGLAAIFAVAAIWALVTYIIILAKGLPQSSVFPF